MCYFGCLVSKQQTHLLFIDVSLGLFDEPNKIKITGFVPYVIMVFDKAKEKNKKKRLHFFYYVPLGLFG